MPFQNGQYCFIGNKNSRARHGFPMAYSRFHKITIIPSSLNGFSSVREGAGGEQCRLQKSIAGIRQVAAAGVEKIVRCSVLPDLVVRAKVSGHFAAVQKGRKVPEGGDVAAGYQRADVVDEIAGEPLDNVKEKGVGEEAAVCTREIREKIPLQIFAGSAAPAPPALSRRTPRTLRLRASASASPLRSALRTQRRYRRRVR
jgi:hypothetical protein